MCPHMKNGDNHIIEFRNIGLKEIIHIKYLTETPAESCCYIYSSGEKNGNEHYTTDETGHRYHHYFQWQVV